MIRLFAAIPIPPDIADGLKRRQQGLPRARWHSDEQLHLTLRFFGEMPEPIAGELDAELASIAARPFDLQLSGVGSFGEGQDVRAVWAGVEESEPLSALAAKCDRAGRRVGLKAEARPFKPHVTLAYLRMTDPQRVAAWVAGHNMLKSPPFRVNSFGLWSSWRSQDGSRYDLEREYSLL